MREIKQKLKAHLFICTNERTDGRSCCAHKGAENLQKKLKEWLKANPELKKQFKVSKSGCLSHCENGIAAVIYPEQKWLTDISEKDFEELKMILVNSAQSV